MLFSSTPDIYFSGMIFWLEETNVSEKYPGHPCGIFHISPTLVLPETGIIYLARSHVTQV